MGQAFNRYLCKAHSGFLPGRALEQIKYTLTLQYNQPLSVYFSGLKFHYEPFTLRVPDVLGDYTGLSGNLGENYDFYFKQTASVLNRFANIFIQFELIISASALKLKNASLAYVTWLQYLH